MPDNQPDRDQRKSEETPSANGTPLVIGACLGVVFGVIIGDAMGNIAMGVAVGVGFGAALSFVAGPALVKMIKK